jgi:adenylate cyclase
VSSSASAISEKARSGLLSLSIEPIHDSYIAREKARRGDVDGAIGLAGNITDDLIAGGSIWSGLATSALVEALIKRGDFDGARVAVDRLADAPTDAGFVLYDITVLRLRTLLARAGGDEASYRGYRDRYRKITTELGFEGHMASAEAMN